MIVTFTKPKREFLWRFPKHLFPGFLALLLFSGNLMAQDIAVSGTVKDVNGEALIGVSVNVAGIKRGVATNQYGRYTITAPSGSTLEFTYLGFLQKLVKIDSRTDINVILEEDPKQLEEVVIMGYGTVNKSDVTGSISSVKMKDVNETKSISISEALQGKVSGVNIVTNTGEPGGAITFNIRE